MELRLNSLLVIALCFSMSYCSGQNGQNTQRQSVTKSYRKDTSALIAHIRIEFRRINSNIKKFRLVTRDLENISSEGGELKLFYDKDNLCKAVLIAFGETGKSISEYYFEDRKLIFIYTIDEFYDQPIYQNKQLPIQRVKENRFYFFNGELIRWLDGNDKIVSYTKYLDKEKRLLKEVDDLIFSQP